jgi:hypothetical protein
MNGTCKLCGNKTSLCESHIIPKFVIDWLKESSVTGYLRQVININLRQQDGPKKYLFCVDCEQLFSKFESEFADKVFYPYISDLNTWGAPTGNLKKIKYDEWLLKFIISIQFRDLVTMDPEIVNTLSNDQLITLEQLIPVFADYLLSKRKDSGANKSYVIFLQNLVFGQGYLPEEMSDKVNFYLLRSIDATIVVSKKRLGVYAKLGPIVLFTTILPNELKRNSHLAIRKQGFLSIVQYLKDAYLNTFIFVDRPNEAMKLGVYSDRQQTKIDQSYKQNSEKIKGSMVTNMQLSDLMLTNRK